MIFHKPVLLDEATSALDVKSGGLYVDATLGGGGHAREIIKRGGKVIGIDQDEEALGYVREAQEENIKEGKLILKQGNFRNLKKILTENGIDEVDGVLFDLGVSSFQIDDSGRGFSLMRNEKLDMRMSGSNTLTAYDVVNKWSEDELYEIFAKYGEEVKARNIAKEIVRERSSRTIETSSELGELVKKVIGGGSQIHPATKIFQAIRIAVNDEINSVKEGLVGAFEVIKPERRVAVISFHSLEDRVVKLYFLRLEREGEGRMLTKKPITAKEAETDENRRSRSAKLRVIEKI